METDRIRIHRYERLEVADVVKPCRLGTTAFICCMLIVPCSISAQSTSNSAAAPSGNSEIAAVGDSLKPSRENLEIPAAPVPGAQTSSAVPHSEQTQQNQTHPPPDSGLSLQSLGFSASQTQGNAQEQARLNKRTHMLKVHQTLGLITAVPMVAALITGPQAKAKGRHGQPITEPTDANLDLHIALGGLTTGLYWTTAYYAIFAPKIAGVKPKGAIRLHRDLEWVHGPGMILTPILGILAYKQENAGEKVHGIASAHGTVAYVTAAAYGASIVAVSWPIHWKFWEGR